MKTEGFERIPDCTFESIEEWVDPNVSMYFLMNPENSYLLWDPFYPTTVPAPTQYQPVKIIDLDRDLLNIDISKELRFLGFTEPEIQRWALIKKVQREFVEFSESVNKKE